MPSFIKTGFICLFLTACTPAVKQYSPVYPPATQTPLSSQEYRIQSGDLLDIKFYYNPDLNEQITVRPDGRISLQLAGEIITAGLTPLQLSNLLTSTYSRELENPEVTVIVRSFNSQRIYVDGEVNNPGMLSIVGPTTVRQAISQAGGLKDTASLDEVIVIRRIADNKLTPIVLNLENTMESAYLDQDIGLLPFDIVHIPKSHIANLNKWVDQYIRKNVPVPIGLGLNVFN
ncbi:MAG: polysaccharide biosynthesis/export family protein [Geobacter sp.]|nr:polysaccharide biosynthesis/export family protein [Geobacter sp.]